MKRRIDGLELDDDPTRIDIDAVHRFLTTSYWAAGRPRAVVEKLVRSAVRVVGLYEGERQVGFARVVSDGETIAYLADVYVLAEYRGRGLGAALVRETVDNDPLRNVRFLLHTCDAHELYEQFGFGPPGPRLMERPAGPEG